MVKMKLNLFRKSSRHYGSDDESEVSATSFASGRYHRKGNESGNESEGSRSTRKNHRGRRKRSGSYKLVETDEQWKEVQRQQGRKGGISEATVRKLGKEIYQQNLFVNVICDDRVCEFWSRNRI